MAAARAGAGAVTVLSPPSAMAENAAHLTSIMLRSVATGADIAVFIGGAPRRRPRLRAGLDPGKETAAILLALVRSGHFPTASLVVDASALTAIAADPEPVFAACRALPVLPW